MDYTRGGSGPPLCLTHQYNAFSIYGPFGGKFTNSFTTYAINARDLGSSGPVRSQDDLTMETAAEDLEAARIALGINRWVVAGHSTGGMIAIIYALKYPESLLGVVLSCTAASYRFVKGSIYDPEGPHAADIILGSSLEKMRTRLSGDPVALKRWREKVITLSFADPTRIPPFLLSSPAPMSVDRMMTFVQKLQDFDTEYQLSTIKVPTLVIIGRYDPQCPIENSERIAKAIPGAKLVVLERSGHFPFIEEPDAYRSAIDSFATENQFSS